MRLVAEALHEVEQRIARRQAERRASGLKEGLAPGVAVDALGDRDQGHLRYAEFRENRLRGAELSLAAIDHDEIRPR